MEQLYRCSFCKEFIGSAEEVKEHEKTCLYNTKLKTCYSCEYYDIKNDVCRNRKNDFVLVGQWRARQSNECHTPRN